MDKAAGINESIGSRDRLTVGAGIRATVKLWQSPVVPVYLNGQSPLAPLSPL